MSLNIRIFASFTLMAIVAVATALIGWSGVRASNDALKTVLEMDLPAEKRLGLIGRHFEAMRSNKNYLLNPNLSVDERQSRHAELVANRDSLVENMKSFDGQLQQISLSPADCTALKAAWKDYGGVMQGWLDGNDEILNEFQAWEGTSILNPAQLWGSLQQYRGDHYFLVRRMSEMIAQRQTIGAAVGADDNRCAFGQWRESFDAGQETFVKNPVFVQAMDQMRDPHREFHRTASEIYRLIEEDPITHETRIITLFSDLLQNADHVVGAFDSMIAESQKSSDFYRAASTISQDKLDPLRVQTVNALDNVITSKEDFDRVDKDMIIAKGERSLLIMKIAVGVAVLMGVILAAFVGYSIRNGLTGPLSRVIGNLSTDAEELTSVSAKLAETSSALSKGAGDQAASLEESASALEEMSSMTQRNAESSKHANGLMSSNAAEVQEGFQAVGRMASAMNDIDKASTEIGRIIKTIEDIAFQTNILALNAAVEAARAGEAGQGFAVVADEVRNLAQRSAQASKDTSSLIENTLASIRTGMGVTHEIEDRFSKLTHSTSDVSHMIEEIDEATNEQAIGMSQLTSSVSRIDKIANENVVNATEAASASDLLNSRAANLRLAVKDLGSILGGAQKTAAKHDNLIPMDEQF
ncbi:hypothetical protein C4J81_03770 [Deltaproteobacteria bacterium Smac51]|nr:hypothetical protein C4J81_03770 [Deltaproteobacteria bacterium Smac51]